MKRGVSVECIKQLACLSAKVFSLLAYVKRLVQADRRMREYELLTLGRSVEIQVRNWALRSSSSVYQKPSVVDSQDI